MRRNMPKEMRSGGFLDQSTVKGNVRTIVICLLCCLVMSHGDCFVSWLYSVLEWEDVASSESTLRVRRFWASVGGSIAVCGGS